MLLFFNKIRRTDRNAIHCNVVHGLILYQEFIWQRCKYIKLNGDNLFKESEGPNCENNFDNYKKILISIDLYY